MNEIREGTPTLNDFDDSVERFRQASVEYRSAMENLAHKIDAVYVASLPGTPENAQGSVDSVRRLMVSGVATRLDEAAGHQRSLLTGALGARQALEDMERLWRRPERSPPS